DGRDHVKDDGYILRPRQLDPELSVLSCVHACPLIGNVSLTEAPHPVSLSLAAGSFSSRHSSSALRTARHCVRTAMLVEPRVTTALVPSHVASSLKRTNTRVLAGSKGML